LDKQIKDEKQQLKDRNKNRDKIFSNAERQALEEDMITYFAFLIEYLKKNCPCLTKQECIVCCLAMHFSALTVTLVFGHNNTNSVKTHKNRIKSKMVKSANCDFLFDYIFHKQNYHK
jgi:hypothetical protein